jgi:hypothetical protein
VAGTNEKKDVVADEALMAVGRVKRNLWRESWVGAIVTVGDPLNRGGSWLTGADFTYATSRFRGDKNFLVGVWGIAIGREDLGHDSTAHGIKIDYPNDLWDMAFTYKRIGRDFDPSLGFVPRTAVQLYTGAIDSSPRLPGGPIQQMFFEFEPTLATSLGGDWESYRVFWAPINWRFRSGDRAEFNIVPAGDRPTDPSKSVMVSSSILARTIGPGIDSRRGRHRSDGYTRRSRGGLAASTTGNLTSTNGRRPGIPCRWSRSSSLENGTSVDCQADTSSRRSWGTGCA